MLSVVYKCVCLLQRRSAPSPRGMLAPGSGSAGVAAPVPGGDRLRSSGPPSYNSTSRPSRSLAQTSDPGNGNRHLNIAHVNINSITAVNRLDELHHFVNINNIHILALTETKLDENVHPALYRLDDFHTPLTHHRNRHGGGTAIYARKTLPITQLNFLELDNSEDWVWCKISISRTSLLICCLYLPPNLDTNRLDQFTEIFSKV